MKTQFKDVAHLYLGCEVMCDNLHNDLIYAYMNTIDTDGYCSVLIGEEAVDLIELKDVTPILKKIEDMEIEDMIILWGLIFWYPYPETHGIRGIQEKDERKSRKVLSAGLERLGIQNDGHIWADSDLTHFYHNQHVVTAFLLKEGYDLFSLIDTNQAIDAKTVNK